VRVEHIRQRRLAAGIPGRLLCAKSGVDRSRLSDIERGYASPSESELLRLEKALDQLISAKERVSELASQVGWPMV